MRFPAIDPAGPAGVAAPAAPHPLRRWRALLGALLLALLPAAANAEVEEWPTTADRGPRTTATRIPWLRFSGDPNAPVELLGGVERGREVLVVREPELTGRQRRLLRRAERHAAKAAKLRDKVGPRATRGEYAIVVPATPRVQPTPTRTVVIDQRRPNVQVVRLGREDDGCDEREVEAIRSEVIEVEGPDEMHGPMIIDARRLARDVERQAQRAVRDAERARDRAQRAQERAQRDAERAAEHGRQRGEEARREVERAMRDADERRRIGEAARGR